MSDDATRAALAEGLAALTRWMADCTAGDIPEDVQARTALILADDLSAIVAARDEPELAALQAGLARSAGAPEATVFGAEPRRLDRYSAAAANGAAADWCELDSGYRRVICHAGIYCLPALMAEAEAEGRTAGEVLRALTLGYETVARIARALPFERLVLHPHGSLAAIGAAAATAALRRLPAGDALAAVASAATMVMPGPYTHPINGAMVRNVWPGVAAWTGLRAADWAVIGIRGLPGALHDVFVEAFGATPRPDELTEGLGEEFAVAGGYHKLHACCQYGHAAIEATQALHARAGGALPEAIHLDTHWRARVMDNPAPETTIAGKFSIQHIAASAAVHGHGGAEAFSAAALHDARVAALRARVTVAPYEPERPWPNDRPTRVTWTMPDGARLTEDVPSARGGPDRPFTPEEIRAKIRDITGAPYPAMADALDALVALDAGTMATTWPDLVARMVTR